MDSLGEVALRIFVPLLPTLVVIGLCGLAERRWPATAVKRGDRLQNLKVWLASLAGQLVVSPVLGGLTTLAVNGAGGGLIDLPSAGWGLALGSLAYLVAMDFGEYLFHRAQHAIPAMWEMHSLHHSDPELDASSAVRHFWLDPLLKTVTIWLAVGLLFKAGPAIVGVYTVFTFYHFITHANVPLGFGGVSWLWNSPQYHRLHHAADPQYYDCNYASLLPIFDVVAGSYRRPQPGEFPETGLDTGAEPRSLAEAVAWPFRQSRALSGLIEAKPVPAPVTSPTHAPTR